MADFITLKNIFSKITTKLQLYFKEKWSSTSCNRHRIATSYVEEVIHWKFDDWRILYKTSRKTTRHALLYALRYVRFLLKLLFVSQVANDVKGAVRPSLPAQESYNEAHQQNAQPLHYLPAGTNILALCFSVSDLSQLTDTHQTQAARKLCLLLIKRT